MFYFDLSCKSFTKYGIKDKPPQIYICDGSGMPLEYRMPKIITVKGTKRTSVYLWFKDSDNVSCCGSAYGQTIAPMVVFAGKHYNSTCLKAKYFAWNILIRLDGPGIICRLVFTPFYNTFVSRR